MYTHYLRVHRTGVGLRARLPLSQLINSYFLKKKKNGDVSLCLSCVRFESILATFLLGVSGISATATVTLAPCAYMTDL